LGWTVAKYFSLQFNSDFSISSSVAFNQQDLEHFLHSAVPLGIYLGGGGLALACLLALLKVLTAFRLSKARKMMDIMTVLMYSTVGAAMFGLSLPVFTAQLDRPTYERVPQIFKDWDRTLDRFQLTSSYGLFRRMTGVDGRPEIIIGRNFFSMKILFSVGVDLVNISVDWLAFQTASQLFARCQQCFRSGSLPALRMRIQSQKQIN
jgi:Lipase maturation factor